MSVQRIELELDRIKDEVGRMSSEEIDDLPFGAIQLDESGNVLKYNRYEENFAGRDRSEVVGKNFFRDVAPCTRVRAFFGAFEEGVRRRELDEVFDFVFRFPQGAKHVRIRMVFSRFGAGSVWIFVTPIG
ncbi:MAG: PAS domain-containing protein [Thermoanaerobaculia bacterium]|nr:PAS domain-containing protein [Thermoanaerobaculia bacterium]